MEHVYINEDGKNIALIIKRNEGEYSVIFSVENLNGKENLNSMSASNIDEVILHLENFLKTIVEEAEYKQFKKEMYLI